MGKARQCLGEDKLTNGLASIIRVTFDAAEIHLEKELILKHLRYSDEVFRHHPYSE